MSNVMICVTQKESAFKLIDEAIKTTIKEEDKIYIVNIGSFEMFYMKKTEEKDSLEYMKKKASELKAEIKIIRSNNLIRSVIEFINENEISTLIMEERRELRGFKKINEELNKTYDKEVECYFLEVK